MAQRTKVQRLLLVEDEEAVAAGLASILQVEGIDVKTVHRGADTAAAVEDFDPEVLVLDLGLPDTNGADVYRALRRHHPELPVIFSTGHGDERAIADLLLLPHVTYLVKPYDFETLLDAIDRVTGVEHHTIWNRGVGA